MLNENFLNAYDDRIVNRTCDYIRFAFKKIIPEFSKILSDLDIDNNSTSYFNIHGIEVTGTKIRSPRGYSLLIATVYDYRSVPLFYYEEYNDSTIDTVGYTSRLDVYSSAFRYFYCQGYTIEGILNAMKIIIPEEYMITRFDIAVDILFDFDSDIIQTPSLLFNMRKDTARNICKFRHTYYVWNTQGVTRFFRVYDKSHDIKKNHKEFLFPDLLDWKITRIECQYGSKYRTDSIEFFLKEYFHESYVLGGQWFRTPVIPSPEKRSLSVSDSLTKTFLKAQKYEIPKTEMLRIFNALLSDYYD